MKNVFDDEETRLVCQTTCRLFLTIGGIAAVICEGIYGFITVGILIMFYLVITKG